MHQPSARNLDLQYRPHPPPGVRQLQLLYGRHERRLDGTACHLHDVLHHRIEGIEGDADDTTGPARHAQDQHTTLGVSESSHLVRKLVPAGFLDPIAGENHLPAIQAPVRSGLNPPEERIGGVRHRVSPSGT